MDPKLASMVTEFLQKVRDLGIGTDALATKTASYLDRVDGAKTASLDARKDRAEQIAYTLSTIRLPSGQSLIAGADQLKVAALMLNDPDRALSVVELLANTIKQESAKTASVEVGRPVKAASSTRPSALDQLYSDNVGR